jgi:cytosine deaminase
MTSHTGFDLVVRNARLWPGERIAAIGVRDGRIAAIEPALDTDGPVIDLDGRLATPGFVDTHVHLDKSCLLDRCAHVGSVAEAIGAVARLKRDFTVEDIHARAARTLEKAIAKGTTRMRTHVEVDPRIGLRGLEAMQALRHAYAWAIDLSICVFPQEGLTNDPGTDELLVASLKAGADLLGGCPYMDARPHAQIERLFELAREFDVDLDLHLDFDLDPSWTHLEDVCRQTDRYKMGGRVAIGHVSKLAAMPPAALDKATRLLAGAGVAVTVLPATDLYLMGRDATHNVPRGLAPAHTLAAQGVLCSVATNNVLNPFTPFGDCSLLRMANLYANAAHAGPEAFATCLELVTSLPARLMRLDDYGLAVGNPADIVALDASSSPGALAEIAEPILAIKRGRISFQRKPIALNYPGVEQLYQATS